MGWNSWDVYGTTVREEEVLSNAEYMARHLAAFGWEYVVVDIQWYAPVTKAHGYIADPVNVTLDEYGRLTPAVNRFPSAAGGAGFKPLADAVHALGLKFGIHIMRGIPRHAADLNLPILGTAARAGDIADRTRTCEWGNQVDMYGVDVAKPGGQEYYDSLGKLYASWGVDYVKADDMLQPYHTSEVAALRSALDRSGRDIVLSLSPGAPPADAIPHAKTHAHLWRISDDFWDRWEDLKAQFSLIHRASPHRAPGSWPDADMLPLGRISIRGERGDERYTNFTPDEQRTLMTLWSFARSPLMLGGDLPSNDPFTLALITNAEILAVDQESAGNRQSYHDGEIVAWTAESLDGAARYVAVFNLADEPRAVDLSWEVLGVDAPIADVRDLWTHTGLGPLPAIHATLAPHAVAAYRVTLASGSAL
jgi:hypothetical protein